MPTIETVTFANCRRQTDGTDKHRLRLDLLAPALALLALSGCGDGATKAAPAAPQIEQISDMVARDVSFLADDGLIVSARHYRSERPKAIILLFHQADSSLAEYATIAPKLVAQGYDVLAVDQRSGGALFGPNQTAARYGKSATYNDALHDLEAALLWSRDRQLPVIVWGSSYSGALVFKLAEKHPAAVSALLAFSPGEYLGHGRPVAKAAAELTIPVYISVGSEPDELTNAKPIFSAVGSQDKVLNVPPIGVHGSSTLIASRNATGAEANWRAVNRFLALVDARAPQHPPMVD